MNLVNEKDRAAALALRDLRHRHSVADVLHAAQHGRDGDELRVKAVGHQTRQRGLAHARRPPEDHGVRTAGFEGDAQRLVGSQQVRLTDHVGQGAGTQAFGQGNVRPMRRIGREEIVAHWQQMKEYSKDFKPALHHVRLGPLACQPPRAPGLRQFGRTEPSVGQHGQDLAGMGQPFGVNVRKDQRRRFAGPRRDHPQRIHDHAAPDIAFAAFASGGDVAGVFQRPRGHQDLPVHFLERTAHPGGREHEQVGAVQRQPAGQFGKAHVVAGHEAHAQTADIQQRRDVGAGGDIGGLLHGEGVVQVQLAVLRQDLAVADGDQRVPDAALARRHVDAHHRGQVRTAAGVEQTRDERAIQRLRGLEHDLRVGDVAGQDAFGQNQQPRPASAGAFHQVHADLRVFFPDAADGELAQGDFQHGFSFVEARARPVGRAAWTYFPTVGAAGATGNS